jgi:hypothetical protein
MARRRIGFDRSAYAFAVAARLTNATQIRAVNSLTIGTKFDGVWPLTDALYPVVGGTAVAHSLNLNNPLQFPITWSGAFTHSTLGISSTGGTGVTTLVPSSSNCYIGIYCVSSPGALAVEDVTSGTAPVRHFMHYQHPAGTFFDAGDDSNSRVTATIAGTTGYRAGSRIGVNMWLFNGSTVAASRPNVTNFGNVPTTPFRIMPPTGPTNNSRVFGSVVIARNGLTPAQHNLLFARIQSYQTALGRAVAP